MSGRGAWMAALGAVLVGLIALNFFRSQTPEGGDLGPVLPASTSEDASRDERRAVDSPREIDASPSIQAADASTAPRGGAPMEAVASPLLPNQVPATPIADALTARGMPVMPELLETERAFAAEPSDPSWSTATEAQILAKIAEIPGLELASLDVECRQTLCRLQLVSPGPAPTGPPGAIFPSPDRAAAHVPGIAELVRETGLKGRWVVGFSPVSMAYLERENADSPAAAP